MFLRHIAFLIILFPTYKLYTSFVILGLKGVIANDTYAITIIYRRVKNISTHLTSTVFLSKLLSCFTQGFREKLAHTPFKF